MEPENTVLDQIHAEIFKQLKIFNPEAKLIPLTKRKISQNINF